MRVLIAAAFAAAMPAAQAATCQATSPRNTVALVELYTSQGARAARRLTAGCPNCRCALMPTAQYRWRCTSAIGITSAGKIRSRNASSMIASRSLLR